MKLNQLLRRYWPEMLLCLVVALPWLSLIALGSVWLWQSGIAWLWSITVATALLIIFHRPGLIDAAAVLAGLSIGPLYPLLLAFLLERTSRGWIFAVAGTGSAVFPWLTGMCSAHFGSLRYELVVPWQRPRQRSWQQRQLALSRYPPGSPGSARMNVTFIRAE